MVDRRQPHQLDPPVPDEDPAGLGGGVGFESTCPVCGSRLGEFIDYCPHCKAHLPFGGTFSPGKTAVAKVMSWILLVVFIGSMIAMFGLIVRQII